MMSRCKCIHFVLWAVFVFGGIVAPATAKASEDQSQAATVFSGVVTFRSGSGPGERGGFVVQDGDRAVWVLEPDRPSGVDDDETSVSQEVRPGDQVIIEGVLERGPHASRIHPRGIRVVGTSPLPPPVDASGTVFLNADNAVRSRVTGVVQRAQCENGVWQLAFFVQGHRLYVRSAQAPVDGEADSLIDAEVEVTGVNGSIRNARGQLLAPFLMINGFDDITRIGRRPAAAFETEFVPLEEVGRFGDSSLAGHRFQTEGVVSRSKAGSYLFLQTDTTGVYVETDDRQSYQPGDRVRVAGFLDLGMKVRGIAAAAIRRVGAETPPHAVSVNSKLIVAAGEHEAVEESAYPDFANRLVRFSATIIGRSPASDGGSLQLASGDSIITAQLQPAAFQAAARYPTGTEIAVTGIVRYDLSRQSEERADGRVSPFGKFMLLVHLPEDISLVRAAPWWTPLRLAVALASVLAVLAAALAWAWSLRRQVERHIVTLADEMRNRREASVEYQATLRERTRLAANLHDTLLQTMAGIGFQLEACQMASTGDEAVSQGGDVTGHLDVARRMIDHAVDDIRGSVWALRSTAVAGMTLEEAIQASLTRLGENHAARLSVRTTGSPYDLPGFVTGNLMLVVQEAVFNALRHGDPKTIDVEIAYQASRTVELVIRDDGMGFRMGSQRGPADGHFGIQGMRERAERLGGRLSLESSPGRGTTVRCSIPCRGYDLALDEGPGQGTGLADRPIETVTRST